MLKKIKNIALSKGIYLVSNSLIKEYGRVLKLNVDSDKKYIKLEIMLEGEIEPTSIKIGKYNVIEESGKKFIEIDNITTSRAWLNTISSKFLNGKRFELNQQYADLIEKII